MFRFFVAFLAIVGHIFAKNAYVTIHYEGTKRDAEYVLGIRVMVKSVKMSDSDADVVVLVSENVSQESRNIFEDDGCRIIDVANIPNPFKDQRRRTYKSHFEFTLNKLHLWDLTEYESVVYMDADNIVLHNIDHLFKCGAFCGVYMNPCFFHTGLMVIRPDHGEYMKLIDALKYLMSYDGADQGFLTAYFGEDMRDAPLFDPTVNSTETRAQRLATGWNLNHMHVYESIHDLSKLKVYEFQEFDFPAHTIGFPIAPELKPWYYLPYLFLSVHWMWDDFRLEAEGFDIAGAAMTFVLTLSLFVTNFFIVLVLERYFPKAFGDSIRKIFKSKRAGAFPYLFSIIVTVISILVPYSVIPAMLQPRIAWSLFLILMWFTIFSLCGVQSIVNKYGWDTMTQRLQVWVSSKAGIVVAVHVLSMCALWFSDSISLKIMMLISVLCSLYWLVAKTIQLFIEEGLGVKNDTTPSLLNNSL